jgi:2-oxoglutarate dehydrogenase E1 component
MRASTLTDAQIQRAVVDSLRALMIIRAYRIRGHLVGRSGPAWDARRGPASRA